MNKRIYTIVSIFLGIGIAVLMPESFVYAQELQQESIGQGIANFLHLIISILSWVRVLFASLAGKLMTNDIVYGEFIHLDASLWKLWNIMKNFAFFALGFLFLLTIFKAVFGKDTNPKDLIKKVLGFVAGGIAVQMSWFLVGATIDLSTILTVSVGSFPSMIIAEDVQMQQEIEKTKVRIPKVKFDPTATTSEQPVSFTDRAQGTGQEMPMDDFLDLVTPSHDSLAGPLLYIGVSVFNIQHYMQNTIDVPSADLSDMLTTILIKAGILIFFTLALILLFIFNVIRVFFLRIFIALSPIFVLLFVLKKTKTSEMEDEHEVLGNKMSVATIAKLIFAPVLFTAYMSIVFLLVVTMQRVIGSNEEDGIFANESVKVTESSVNINDTYEFHLNGDLWGKVKEGATTTITDLILCALTLFLLYGLIYLIKESAKGGIGGKAMENTYNLEKKALQNIPIGNTSIGGIQQTGKKYFGRNSKILQGLENKQQEDVDKLKEAIGLGGKGFNAADKKKIKQHYQQDHWTGGKSDFLKDISKVLQDKDAKNFQGVPNFNNQSDVVNRVDTRLQDKPEDSSGLQTNRQKYLYERYRHTPSLYNQLKGLLDEETSPSLKTVTDAIQNSSLNTTNKAKVLSDLFNAITGSSKSIKTSTTFFKTQFK